MWKQTFLRPLLVAIGIVCTPAFSGSLWAQGRGGDAFEHAREVQERHTDRLMAKAGIVGTSVGFDDRGRQAVLLLLEEPDVPDIPEQLEDVQVRPVVTGRIYALSFWDLWANPSAIWKSTTPAAPANLQATAISSSQINLTWTDNAGNEQGFRIERTTTGMFSQIATVAANVTAYSDKNLSSSTTYTYRVRAYNIAGNSSYSNQASATTEMPALWCKRPVPIGVSTGHPKITAGTIGCRVKKADKLYVLSNNHVYANEDKASIGDYVLQPGPYDGGISPRDAIGKLSAFTQIVFSQWATNVVDAAIAEVLVDSSGASLVSNSTPSGGYGTPSSTTASASVGQAVQKYGRTTGLTQGQVYAVNATVNVTYNTGTARFIKQILITPGTFCSGGDSGSLIVTADTDGDHPVGLLFAGSSSYTVANPIDEVLSAFGVTVDGK